MTSLRDKNTVVIGGSSGVGKATVKALVSDGLRVTAVARSADRLRALETEVSEGLATLQGDATDPVSVERLLRELKPELVVLTAGVTPRMGRLDEFDWESFSAAWDVDVKAAFLLIKQALTLPLAPGSIVVVVSSGAAIDGSPLSGGLRRGQTHGMAPRRLCAESVRREGARHPLSRGVARPIEGTTIGARAASAYSAMRGITAEVFMERVGVSLDRSPPQS
jgi:NAD(P)-dependent dehydrogenase (short-subunit alcohol dehydrogenase family)